MRISAFLSMHSCEPAMLESLLVRSLALSKGCFSELPRSDALAPKATLRGKLQRWRDKMAQTYDEGIQFVLEDNLLNYLLVASEKQGAALTGFWLIKTCQVFYERALSAPYVPLYL